MRFNILPIIAFFILFTACKKELPDDRHHLKYAPYDIKLVPPEIVDRMQQLLKDHPELNAKGVFYYKYWDADGKYILLLSVFPPVGFYTPPNEDDLPAFSDLYTYNTAHLISSTVFLNNSLAAYNCSKIEIYMMFPNDIDAYISYY